jgi:hypothetical protein
MHEDRLVVIYNDEHGEFRWHVERRHRFGALEVTADSGRGFPSRAAATAAAEAHNLWLPILQLHLDYAEEIDGDLVAVASEDFSRER